MSYEIYRVAYLERRNISLGHFIRFWGKEPRDFAPYKWVIRVLYGLLLPLLYPFFMKVTWKMKRRLQKTIKYPITPTLHHQVNIPCLPTCLTVSNDYLFYPPPERGFCIFFLSLQNYVYVFLLRNLFKKNKLYDFAKV